MKHESPLGKATSYSSGYDPKLLFAIARSESRDALRLGESLPFSGVDIWNAWDLTWLNRAGLPRVAAAELRVPARSANLIESKSLKLYLGSFAMSRFDSSDEVVGHGDALERRAEHELAGVEDEGVVGVGYDLGGQVGL